MKDLLLIVALISSVAIAYTPVKLLEKFIKERQKRNNPHIYKK